MLTTGTTSTAGQEGEETWELIQWWPTECSPAVPRMGARLFDMRGTVANVQVLPCSLFFRGSWTQSTGKMSKLLWYWQASLFWLLCLCFFFADIFTADFLPTSLQTGTPSFPAPHEPPLAAQRGTGAGRCTFYFVPCTFPTAKGENILGPLVSPPSMQYYQILWPDCGTSLFFRPSPLPWSGNPACGPSVWSSSLPHLMHLRFAQLLFSWQWGHFRSVDPPGIFATQKNKETKNYI